MTLGPMMQRCGTCGEQWWDAHCCPKQKPPMTVAGFFSEATLLNLRMLGTPEETRAALDLKDAEIARLRAALEMAYCQVVGADSPNGLSACDDFKDWLRTLGPNVEANRPPTARGTT